MMSDHGLLRTGPKPRNASAGGACLAVCLGMASLPVLVDLYLWPATTAAVPTAGSVLFQGGEVFRSPSGLLEALAQCPAGADRRDPASVLLRVQLTASTSTWDSPAEYGLASCAAGVLGVPAQGREFLGHLPGKSGYPPLSATLCGDQTLIGVAAAIRELHVAGRGFMAPQPAGRHRTESGR